jgi:membrane protease YdiL (CAAX protease family)
VRGLLITIAKIAAFLAIWALVMVGGLRLLFSVAFDLLPGSPVSERFVPAFRLAIVAVTAIAALVALAFMVRVVDRRGWDSIGFPWRRASDLLWGAAVGGAVVVVSLAALAAAGPARIALDVDGFSIGALFFASFVCLVSVVQDMILARSYIFQELWSKYGAAAAIAITTLLMDGALPWLMLQYTKPELAPTVAQLSSAVVAGAVYGLAYVRTGALWLPIGLAFGREVLVGPVLGINERANDIGLGAWSFLEITIDAEVFHTARSISGSLFALVVVALVTARTSPRTLPARQ